MYTLDLTDDSATHYEIISQGFLMCRRREIGIGEWDTAVDLARKIKSLGVENGTAPDGTQLYDLQPGGGTLTLNKPELKLLVDMIENVSWKPATLEKVVMVRDWLKGLKWESPRVEA